MRNRVRSGVPEKASSATEHPGEGADPHERPRAPPLLRGAPQPFAIGNGPGQPAQPPDGEDHQPEPTAGELRPLVARQAEVFGVQPRHDVDAPTAGMGEGVPHDVGDGADDHGEGEPRQVGAGHPGRPRQSLPQAAGHQVTDRCLHQQPPEDHREEADGEVDGDDPDGAVAQRGGAATGEEPRVVRCHRADHEGRGSEPVRAAHHRQHGRDVAHREGHTQTLAAPSRAELGGPGTRRGPATLVG